LENPVQKKKTIFGAKSKHLDQLVSQILKQSDEDDAQAPSGLPETDAGQSEARIGRYKLLELLGEGGMGLVYLAQQEHPIRRQVAIKVIKPGMDSARVIARFEAERQALALLDHPNIAHIYDAGTTEAGQPYFVMEQVKGLPITEHCDHYKLTIEQRLRLFQQVCQAVHHAHQKGIIHRDIKPSNILVSIYEDQSVPNIIDFGVAKALTQALTEHTLYTEQGQLFGTPEYMSPEQADMAIQDIDTRSDIYSLGVLLYELLTGVLPFDSHTLRQGGGDNMRKLVLETDPKTPSTRLVELGKEAVTIAQNRRMEIQTLARHLRKELEWIPLKAIRKERVERYQSASELAHDIENYLKGAALTAGPPSTVYRLKKFVRRNRALVMGIAAVLIVSIVCTLVSTGFAFKATRQAGITQAISDFFIHDLLGAAGPLGGTEPEVTVKSFLDAASENLAVRFAGKPLIEAFMRQHIGYTHQKLGNLDAAELNLKRAIDLRRKEGLGFNDFQTLRSMMALSWVYMSDFMIYAKVESLSKAESLLDKTVAGMRRVKGEDDWNFLEATSRLAWIYYFQGRLDEAEKLQVAAIELVQRELGPDHEYAPNHMEGLAAVYYKQGHSEKALKLCREALDISRHHSGGGPGETANISRTLADWCTESGLYDEAEDLYIEAWEIRREEHSDEHRATLEIIGKLGALYCKMKRYDEAEPLLNQEFETNRRLFGEEDWGTLASMIRVAELYRDREQFNDAEQLLLEAQKIVSPEFRNDQKVTGKSINDLIKLYEAWGRPDKAEEWQDKLSALSDQPSVTNEKAGN
jgi:eukaryotic-like serine/threonine-protein kinase